MQQKQRLTDDLEHLLQRFNEQESHEKDSQGIEGDEIEEIDVYFVRRPKKGEEGSQQIIESALQQRPRRTLPVASFVALTVNILLFLSVLVFAILPQLTTTVTITLLPVEKQVRLTATIIAVSGIPTNGQIHARFLPAFTLTQSTTAQATGRGHQTAKQAQGFLTFYNGQFTPQTIATGTTLKGADGVQVITDQNAYLPAANPPSLGQITVLAHAILPGSQGNIPTRDINQACCATSVLAVNTAPFTGGQKERDYTYVTNTDLQSAVTSLTTTVAASENAALQAQLTTHEGLITPICTPTVTSNHQPRDEAAFITVKVSENCTGVAYDKAALQAQATQLLTDQAIKTVGTHYSLIGGIQLTVLHATTANRTNRIATIVASVSGIWVYQITQQERQNIKQLIAGKRKVDALRILLSLPGIERASIQWGYETKLPTDTSHIHMVLIYGI